jgi:hypothetical protein
MNLAAREASVEGSPQEYFLSRLNSRRMTGNMHMNIMNNGNMMNNGNYNQNGFNGNNGGMNNVGNNETE